MMDPVTGALVGKAAITGAKAAWNSDFRKKHIMKTDKEKKTRTSRTQSTRNTT